MKIWMMTSQQGFCVGIYSIFQQHRPNLHLYIGLINRLSLYVIQKELLEFIIQNLLMYIRATIGDLDSSNETARGG